MKVFFLISGCSSLCLFVDVTRSRKRHGMFPQKRHVRSHKVTYFILLLFVKSSFFSEFIGRGKLNYSIIVFHVTTHTYSYTPLHPAIVFCGMVCDVWFFSDVIYLSERGKNLDRRAEKRTDCLSRLLLLSRDHVWSWNPEAGRKTWNLVYNIKPILVEYRLLLFVLINWHLKLKYIY